MTKTTPEQNKAIVLEAFETLFNHRDYAATDRFWSDHYIQHSAHIAPGRAGLFDLIRTLPETPRYENQLIVAEGDYVIVRTDADEILVDAAKPLRANAGPNEPRLGQPLQCANDGNLAGG
jgi:predicted SnoaL-like aldol condensation-catalyzing enzyme